MEQLGAATAVENAATIRKPARLHVIFHGLCAFVQEKTRIRVLLPDVGEQHSYRAGNWLGETAIARGSVLQLIGAEAGEGTFDSSRNLVIAGPFKQSGVKPYAEIEFPRPSQIYSLRCAEVSKEEDFAGASVDRLNDSGKLATIQVFEFAVDDVNGLRLGGHHWIPVVAGGVITLHVFAEPETPQGMRHSLREFRAGSELFDGLDLGLRRVPPLPALAAQSVPAGVLLEELEDLIPRTRRMSLLGRFRRRNQDINEIWDNEEEYGEDPSACTYTVVDNSGEE